MSCESYLSVGHCSPCHSLPIPIFFHRTIKVRQNYFEPARHSWGGDRLRFHCRSRAVPLPSNAMSEMWHMLKWRVLPVYRLTDVCKWTASSPPLPLLWPWARIGCLLRSACCGLISAWHGKSIRKPPVPRVPHACLARMCHWKGFKSLCKPPLVWPSSWTMTYVIRELIIVGNEEVCVSNLCSFVRAILSVAFVQIIWFHWWQK